MYYSGRWLKTEKGKATIPTDIAIYIKQILQRQMSQEKGKTTLKFPCL